MKGISRPAPIRLRIGQRTDKPHEFHDTTGISMREYQGASPRFLAPDMQKMQWLPIDGRDKLGKLVQKGFLLAPVILVPPVMG